MPDVTVLRRDLLRLTGVALAGAALSACTTSGDSTIPSTASPGGPEDPDRALRETVAADEERLVAAYAAATGLPTGLQARVAELGSRHAVYAAAVLPRTPTASSTGSGSASGATSTSGSASGSPSGPPPPADQANSAAVTLRSLKALETRAAADRAAQSVRATDPELARTIVLAGTGAAAAAQVLTGVKVSR